MNTANLLTATGGNSIASSAIGLGLIRLLDDAKGYLLVIGIAICVVSLIYLYSRKAAAAEYEQVEIEKKIKTTIYAAVGIVAASSIIMLVTGYFK